MFTDAHARFFNTFGFLKLPGLFANEIEQIETSFTEVWDQVGGGHAGESHDEIQRSMLVPFIDQNQYGPKIFDTSLSDV